MRRPNALAAIALLLAGTLALAQTQRLAPRVAPPQLNERLGPTPISQPGRDMSGSVYGLMPVNAALRVDFPATRAAGSPALFVRALGAGPQGLCISIKRAQGDYQASFATQIPGGRGLAQIPFDSSLAVRKHMREMRPAALELAVRATEPQGGKCLTRAPLLPAAWTSAPATDWALLVGAGNLGLPTTRVAGGPVRECQPLETLLKRSDYRAGVFSYACPVAVNLPKCPALVPVQVLWMDGARVAAEARIEVRPPCRDGANG